MMAYSVTETHRALNSLSLVRFQVGVPNKNILRDATVVSAAAREDKKPKHADGLAWRSMFLFGSINRRKK